MEPQVLTSATGLTVGDLFDFREAMVNERRLCPDAPPWLLNEEGMFEQRLESFGQLDLSEEHPLVVKDCAERARRDDSYAWLK